MYNYIQKHSFYAIFIYLSICSVVFCNTPPKTFTAVYTDTPPIIDGNEDDICWASASRLTSFTSVVTKSRPIDRTYVKICFDKQNIYILAICEDHDISNLQATTRKYDRYFNDEDHFEFQFDTNHNRRSGYLFYVNALGTRRDGSRNDYVLTDSWDATWRCKTTIKADRWIAEMVIPIDNMHFITEDDQTWGINFHRGFRGKHERSHWNYHPDDSFQPQNYGRVTGLNLKQTKVNLNPSLEYYISSSSDLKESDNHFSSGGDVTLRLNSSFVSTFTLNPDYGQIEADADSISLRDTERLFFEKRPFFKEGAELFTTPINLYYSKRFVDIDVGAKVTGAGKKWHTGVLAVDGEIKRAKSHRDTDLTPGVFTVARTTYDLSDKTMIGALFINTDRENGIRRTLSTDMKHQFNPHTSIALQAVAVANNETYFYETTDHNDKRHHYLRKDEQSESAYNFTINHHQDPFRMGVSIKDYSENFSPDMGYILYNDIRGADAWITKTVYPNDASIEKHIFNYSCEYYENHDHIVTHRRSTESLALHFTNKLDFKVRRSDTYRYGYHNHNNAFEIVYDKDNFWQSTAVEFATGDHYDISYEKYALDKNVKWNKEITTRFGTEFRKENNIDQTEQEVWWYYIANEWFFNNHTSIKLSIDHTNQQRHRYTLLFAWLPIDPFDFYLQLSDVEYDYNDYVLGNDFIHDAINDIPHPLSKNFQGRELTLFAKISKRF